MGRVKSFLFRSTSTVGFVFSIIGIILLALAISFICFAFGYWLVSLILIAFFNFILPWTWGYAFGGWLIALVVGFFIAPGLFITGSKN